MNGKGETEKHLPPGGEHSKITYQRVAVKAVQQGLCIQNNKKTKSFFFF